MNSRSEFPFIKVSGNKSAKFSSPIKIFLIVFILSLPIFWEINILEEKLKDFFYWREIAENPQFLAAQANQLILEQKLRNLEPFRNKNIPDLEIEAKSAISVLVDNEGKEKVLFEKESNQKLPMASLTKLMTAWVVLEYYDLSKEITISKLATNQYGDIRKLEEGKTFTTEYLLYPLLMESSNGAAFALTNDYEGNFIELMNREAKKIGLDDTLFNNSSGLDPEDSKTEINYSTANDLVKLTKKLLEKPLIWDILSIPKYSEYGPELINTNRFLTIGYPADWQDRIIGGKTGYTDKAGGCLLLVIKAPRSQGFLISIILGSDGKENRFEEMRKLIDWLNQAYKW